MNNSKKKIFNAIDTVNIYFYVVREILVNLIGYKLGLRSFIGRGRVNNVTGNIKSDIQDKGHKHFKLISAVLNHNKLKIKKKSFLEIGPGGTLLNGLMLTLNGWEHYYAVDAFPSRVWSFYPMQIYKHFIKLLPKEKRKNAENILRSSVNNKGPIFYFPNGGLNGKSFNKKVKNNSIDFIYSWGVLEHFVNPKEAFESNYRLLKKGGYALHVIDFHPHTWMRFQKPYYFLTISDFLWNLMYKDRGFINRLRPSTYLEFAECAGFDIKVLKTEISNSNINNYRKNFLKRFLDKDTVDILTDRVFILLSKP